MVVFFLHFGSVFFKNLVVFFRIFSGSVYPLLILKLRAPLVIQGARFGLSSPIVVKGGQSESRWFKGITLDFITYITKKL